MLCSVLEMSSGKNFIKSTTHIGWDTLLPCPACGGKNSAIKISFLDALRFVTCSDCGLSGPTFTKEELAILTWNLLPRSPEFSSVRPTSEGFYWVKDKTGSTDVALVCKEFTSHPKKLVAFYTGNEVEEDIDNIEGAEWAGPLEAPK